MQQRSGHWRRVIASGALWSVVYNLCWGLAWFGFMRSEWISAVAALGQRLPWTAEVWFVWVTFTVPLGVVMMAYASSCNHSFWKMVVASTAAWLLMALGMIIWGIHESLSIRVLALDSLVSLVAIMAASLIGAWSLGSVHLGEATSGPRVG